jgi:hypothetical protein
MCTSVRIVIRSSASPTARVCWRDDKLPRNEIDITTSLDDRTTMEEKNKSRLKRPIHPMPDFVLAELENENLIEEYHARPAYQQNDYLGWITRAKRDETKQKRLRQMLDELASGDRYMKMAYRRGGKRGE